MSLRLRLIVLPSVIVLGGLLLMALLEIGNARDRVSLETASALELGRAIVTQTLERPGGEAQVERIAAELPQVRHLSWSARLPGGEQAAAPAAAPGAPAWFTDLVVPGPHREVFPVTVAGRVAGEIVMTANPADEVRELWRDWLGRTVALAILAGVIIIVVVASVTKALQPLGALADGLDRLAGGDFEVALPRTRDVELRRLSERFNDLAASLSRVTQDNRLLIHKLMSVQDAERKEIAHELHDEFGPSLFGIRADLNALGKLIRTEGAARADVEERLDSIASLVEQIQRINSGLLERLRPLVLDQMGLSQALERLVADWRARYPDLRWNTEIGEVGELDEPVALAIYRAARECLTNVVRHSQASAVEVSLCRSGGQVSLSVTDDGRGLGAAARFGFGLLGVAERTRALGGRLRTRDRQSGGAVIEVMLPAAAPA